MSMCGRFGSLCLSIFVYFEYGFLLIVGKMFEWFLSGWSQEENEQNCCVTKY